MGNVGVFWSFCGKKLSRVSLGSAEAVYLSASSGQNKQNNGTMKYAGVSRASTNELAAPPPPRAAGRHPTVVALEHH